MHFANRLADLPESVLKTAQVRADMLKADTEERAEGVAQRRTKKMMRLLKDGRAEETVRIARLLERSLT